MEQTQVIIVGAGPAGLVLGLSLAQCGVKSVILEKDNDMTDDPRGVYLTGDALRILHHMGLGSSMPKIGFSARGFRFHRSSFAEPQFHQIDLVGDIFKHALPPCMLQVQPMLERSLRDAAQATSLCDLRTGCTVEKHIPTEFGPSVEYTDQSGEKKRLQGSWLVGADGKRGVVRKHFLEKQADVRQVDSDYRYDGTWIAANLKINKLTPESHPDFPLWSLGYTPDQVDDMFWQKDWHFCCPPGKPTASGPFGPLEERLWRHEFRQDSWVDDAEAEKLFWDHITPMITRNRDLQGKEFSSGAVAFPRDCIEIRRCRPFNFTHKVVNRWFHERTILIGDAAHVFPPFGGQGIASGLRDAHQLAWRLALLTRHEVMDEALSHEILSAWAAERIQSVKTAAAITEGNGKLCNEGPTIGFHAMCPAEKAGSSLPPGLVPQNPEVVAEELGFKNVKGGFFLPEHNGGGKMSQIYIQTGQTKEHILSDQILRTGNGSFTLLAMGEDQVQAYNDAVAALKATGIDSDLLSIDSIAVFSPDATASMSHSFRSFRPLQSVDLTDAERMEGYDHNNFMSRLGSSTRFAIVRPDLYIFATAESTKELEECLHKLKKMIGA